MKKIGTAKINIACMSSWNVHRKVCCRENTPKDVCRHTTQSRKQCSARPQIHSEYRDSCFPACRQSLATYLFVSPSLIVLSFSNLHALSISTLKYLRQKRKLIRRRPLSYLIWKTQHLYLRIRSPRHEKQVWKPLYSRHSNVPLS